MTAETRNMLDCKIDQQELKKMLLGSDDKWRGTCKKAVSYTLVIEPIANCYLGLGWYLEDLSFSVKNAKTVEVFVDDVSVLSVRLPRFHCRGFLTTYCSRLRFSSIFCLLSSCSCCCKDLEQFAS